jgi:nicotinamidase-related amidase
MLHESPIRITEFPMQLNPKITALVLIDLQTGVLAMPVAPHSATAVYDRSMRLAQRFRSAGAPVVWVRVSFSQDKADAPRSTVDQPTNYASLPSGWDEFPEPPPQSDLVITKRQWGAFYGTELDLQLRRRGMRTLVLGGVATNFGVESTARDAWERGYEVVIAEDVTSSLSGELHDFSMQHILPRIGVISSSAAISFEEG